MTDQAETPMNKVDGGDSAASPAGLPEPVRHVPGQRGIRAWLSRPTIREIRAKASAPRRGFPGWDEQQNAESRIPEDETIHLGGVSLVEAFTPSTIHALYNALEKIPLYDAERKEQWLRALKASRGRPYGGGWQSLVVVRRPGEFIGGDGFHDVTLPTGIDAVWLQLHYPTASVAMVVATFALAEDVGDLSEVLRAEYQTTAGEVRIVVHGPLRQLRVRLPWSRPKKYRVETPFVGVHAKRYRAYEEIGTRIAGECQHWFANLFHGRFADEPIGERPQVRIVLTKNADPLDAPGKPLGAIGLNPYDTWRSVSRPGWVMTFRAVRPDGHTRSEMLIAACRSDVAEEAGVESPSAWIITQKFMDTHAELVVFWATNELLSLYSRRLGNLRDRATPRKRFSRTVQEAKALDKFLLGDGLDASSVTSDVLVSVEDLKSFRRRLTEYTEYANHRPAQLANGREPLQFLPELRETLIRQAKRLVKDMTATTQGIGASAQLRQSIANTQLQRWVLGLSVVATVIAVIGLMMSIKNS